MKPWNNSILMFWKTSAKVFLVDLLVVHVAPEKIQIDFRKKGEQVTPGSCIQICVQLKTSIKN